MDIHIDNFNIINFSISYLKKIEKKYPNYKTSLINEIYTKNHGTFYLSNNKIYTLEHSNFQSKKKTLPSFSAFLIPTSIKKHIYSCVPYDDHFLVKTKIIEFNLSTLIKLIIKLYIDTDSSTPHIITDFHFFLTDDTYEIEDISIIEHINSILTIITNKK